MPIKPIMRGQILNPPVPNARVIQHNIFNQPNTPATRLSRKPLIISQTPMSRIDPVEVCDGIAMIGKSRCPILEYRSWPNLSETHRLYVVERLDHASDIAAMACVGIFAVYPIPQARNCIIRGVAVHKPIGADQEHGVGLREAIRRVGGPPLKSNLDLLGRSTGSLQGKHQGARLRPMGQLKMHKQVVRTVTAFLPQTCDPSILSRHTRAGKTRRMHHEHETSILKIHPPIRGLHPNGASRRRCG